MIGKRLAYRNWGIATKLVVVFCVFGLIPMAAVGMIAFNATKGMEDTVGQKFKDNAVTIADKIDRNLFERYGDVQAFTYNEVVERVSNWGDQTEDNAITKKMNQYVQAYGIYYLTMMVDTGGSLVAVNTRDAAGKPIDYKSLYQKNYRETSWFKAVEAKNFTTKMPFTAPGNDVSTGTFIEDVHIDSYVKTAYPKDDALTMGFTAPVYGDTGQIIGYWSNRAKFSLVEEIFAEAYQELKANGYAGAELTLLEATGRVLIDYDPVTRGAETTIHDFENVLFKLNLAEKGVAVAQKAVAGETGFLNALHARKEIMQTGGYTHLKGALGYPGMNWSVMVRVPQEEAAAEAISIQRNVFLTMVVCLALIIPIGLIIGRRSARGLIEVSEVAQKAAQGDLTQRVTVRSWDELGRMGNALNQMFDNVAEVVGQVRQSADQVTTASTEISQGNEDLSQRTSGQASSLEETSASMEQMTSSVKQNADNAKQANQLAIAARDVAEKGGRVTSDAVRAMEEINKSSKKIADIINVIDEIAFQTNLLALNAAVEAARAGEQGRGFAVVAAEVRNLAQRSATAAKEIKGHINESVQKVSEGSELVGQSGQTLDEIVNSVKRVTDIIAEISAASQEQSSGIDQVNKAIMQMDQTTQQNAALVEQAASSAQAMKQQAAGLQNQVEFFTLNEEQSHRRDSEMPRAEVKPKAAKTGAHFPVSPSLNYGSAPATSSKRDAPVPVGIAGGNGFDRRQAEDSFEEF